MQGEPKAQRCYGSPQIDSARPTHQPSAARSGSQGHVAPDRSQTTAGEALVFGDPNGTPFQPEKLYRDADSAWHHAGTHERLRLHQARHTYASFMIAAGVNAKALSSFIGHASIPVTFDLYGHLMPGSEAEGAALLDAYLDDQTDK